MVCCSKKFLRFGNGAILVCAIRKNITPFLSSIKNNPGEEGRTKREKRKIKANLLLKIGFYFED